MSSQRHPGIDLTSTQQMLLQELVTLYRESEDPVKGAAVATAVDRNPGTIRNQMQSLKALQLVDGIPGPRGGYKPTARAFEILSVQDINEPAEVPLYCEGDRVDGVVVAEIDLNTVRHPENCQAEIQLQGMPADTFTDGDSVLVGPTPLSELRIDGTVAGVDDVNGTLVLAVESMTAPGAAP